MSKSLRLRRPRVLTDDDLARIHEAALLIMARQGLRVDDPQGTEACRRAGLQVTDGRVFPDACVAEDFLAKSRGREGKGSEEEDAREASVDLSLSPSQYTTNYHLLTTDEIVPFRAEHLIEAVRLVDALASRGVIGAAPGTPMDVPPMLQPVVKYRITATYSRQGRWPVEPRHPQTLPFIMDMAEVLGHPYRWHHIYVVSPLALSDESLEFLRAGEGRLDGVHVSNMSSVGGTAPINICQALALGVAETVAAGIVVGLSSGLEVDWSVRCCPLDLRTMTLSLGGPEEHLFQWASDEVNAFYHGCEPTRTSGTLHSQAKLPDAQATAERMGGMLTSALFGARHFGGAGMLSLDEVFSPEQLVLDCELKDHVQRLLEGIEAYCDPSACLDEVAAGIAEGGFTGLQSTAREWRGVYLSPRLFERRALHAWMAAGSPDLRTRAKDCAKKYLQEHEYELEADLQREIERISANAKRALVDEA